MPNEYVFDQVTVDPSLEFRDSQIVRGPLREAAIPIFIDEYLKLVQEVTDDVDNPPGCHSMLRNIDGKAFFEKRNGPDFEFNTFREYRKFLRIQRDAQEIANRESRTLLAWRNGDPIGGIVLYNPVITARRNDGVIEFAAHVGPFITDRRLSAVIMTHLLENEVTATPTFLSENTSPLTMQLVEWRFPEYRQNRWRTDFTSAQVWVDNFAEHDREFETKDGETYWRTLRKRAALVTARDLS